MGSTTVYVLLTFLQFCSFIATVLSCYNCMGRRGYGGGMGMQPGMAGMGMGGRPLFPHFGPAPIGFLGAMG
ncbi:hypothetical protein RB195_015871 [Necator americanus]|uniref:Uncharacterized protein n=1 Tax=Necator americanus TaxID=51031 RepID=A0ABR1E6L3_NECAM